MTALLIAEHDNVTLKPATAQALAAALQMTDVVDILVAGSNGQSVAEQAAALSGVRTVYYADHPQLAQESPEVLARLVLDEAEGYSHVLFVASAVGKSAMPRVAAKLDVSPRLRHSRRQGTQDVRPRHLCGFAPCNRRGDRSGRRRHDSHDGF